MNAPTTTKTNAEMLADVPGILGTLLLRFERDAQGLSDYLTHLEQQQQVDRIFYGVRHQLMITHRWSHEAATAVANQYRTMLNVRLKRPEAFNCEPRPRQPQANH